MEQLNADSWLHILKYLPVTSQLALIEAVPNIELIVDYNLQREATKKGLGIYMEERAVEVLGRALVDGVGGPQYGLGVPSPPQHSPSPPQHSPSAPPPSRRAKGQPHRYRGGFKEEMMELLREEERLRREEHRLRREDQRQLNQILSLFITADAELV